MARQLRIEYDGAIYHVTVRANGRENIFKDDVDRRYLLSRIGEASERCQVRVYLFCLMSNHFHLVLETPMGNLGQFMQNVLTGYGVCFNMRHRRHGHVTQGRYSARLVEGDEYLLKLSRYVHLNPVKINRFLGLTRAEKVKHLRGYTWSSYQGYIGSSGKLKCVDYGPMFELVGGRKKDKECSYRRFVESGIETEDEEFLVDLERSPRCIGSEKFREYVDSRYAELLQDRQVAEDVSFRKLGTFVPEDVVLDIVAKRAKVERADLLRRRRDSTHRALASSMLCKYSGLTQRAAAKVLGMKTGVAVSCQLRALSTRIKKCDGLEKLVTRIEKDLRVLQRSSR